MLGLERRRRGHRRAEDGGARDGQAGVVAFEGRYHGLGYGPLAACGLARVVPRAVRRAARTPRHVRAVSRRPRPSSTTRSIHVQNALAPADVGAVLVEPILGRGGCVVPPPLFLRRFAIACDRRGRAPRRRRDLDRPRAERRRCSCRVSQGVLAGRRLPRQGRSAAACRSRRASVREGDGAVGRRTAGRRSTRRRTSAPARVRRRARDARRGFERARPRRSRAAQRASDFLERAREALAGDARRARRARARPDGRRPARLRARARSA